ncbi:MAG: beta-galactosidase [Armatimonadota bacterium]|nr:MAG: beta-galactosidase [Armatimonadota bacterium]
MKRCLMALLALIGITSLCHADRVLYDLETPGALPPLESQGAEVALARAPSGQGQVLRITASEGRWSSVRFPAEGVWDWRGYTGVAVEVTNPGHRQVQVFLRVENPREESTLRRRPPGNMTRMPVGAGETAIVALRFKTGDERQLWGMHAYPIIDGYPSGPASGEVMDLAKIAAISVGIGRAEPGDEVLIDNLRLWGGPDSRAEQVTPFVDQYGQYALQDWSGKVKSDEDLAAQGEAEREELAHTRPLPDRDEYGGWAAGPQMEATGWFRTEKVNGKWWLVTPTGHLFFSTGIDVVLSGQHTFIAERDGYFQWLPERDGPYAECFGFDPTPLNNAGPLQETGGESFNFYRANLVRKYGDDWHAKWMGMTFDRMSAWGFNTIAGWSEEQVYRKSPHPFAVCVWFSGEERPIAGAYGYWSKMPDVYDPSFDEEVDRVMAEAAAKYADNPRCIGYFVQNEMSWGRGDRFNVAGGTLSSPADQPCRRVFVSILEEKYGSLKALNAAWGADAQSWEELRAPREPNEACKEDLRAFTYQYSLAYFRKVHAAIKKHAPNQLDLGCRFAQYNQETLRACAKVADVVSFNIYRRSVDAESWGHTADLGKPCIIGEFHFGALDRGSLHPGLVVVKDQAERAQAYTNYVNRVADLPAFVGCHWFQYVDEPITGRTLDGENYNCGLVTVTDTPFAELFEAAREANEGIYERRYHGAGY